jgi:hypothetical protein
MFSAMCKHMHMLYAMKPHAFYMSICTCCMVLCEHMMMYMRYQHALRRFLVHARNVCFIKLLSCIVHDMVVLGRDVYHGSGHSAYLASSIVGFQHTAFTPLGILNACYVTVLMIGESMSWAVCDAETNACRSTSVAHARCHMIFDEQHQAK